MAAGLRAPGYSVGTVELKAVDDGVAAAAVLVFSRLNWSLMAYVGLLLWAAILSSWTWRCRLVAILEKRCENADLAATSVDCEHWELALSEA